MTQTYAVHRRAKSEQAETAPAARVPGPSLAALQGGAMPSREQLGDRIALSSAIQSKMENAFGTDFSGLQFHESETVAEAGADAVTMGRHIAFAPGKLSAPGGQELLGHELSHVVSQARGEAAGRGFLNDSALESRADREGAMAAAGGSVYAGPVTPLSSSSAASAAGPMQARKAKDKAADSLKHMASDGRSAEGDAYFKRRFGENEGGGVNHGELKDSHKFRLFLRQSYGKSDEEKDALYDMYTNPDRQEDYLQHIRQLTDETMAMDMDSFNLKDKKSLLGKSQWLSDKTTDVMALSDVVKDNQKALGYSDKFVSEDFGSRRQYMMASKLDARGRLREIAGEAEKGSAAQSDSAKVNFGDSGTNQGFAAFKDRYVTKNRADKLKEVGRNYNPISMAHYQAATPEQRAAGKSYIQDSRDINGMLRGGAAGLTDEKKSELEAMSSNLSGMMQTLDTDQTGYRSISDAGLLPLLEQAGLSDAVLNENGTVNHERLLQNKDRLVGMTFQDKGFTSTTASSQFAAKWGSNLGRRDLNFFKKRALDRRGVSQEERAHPHNAGLMDISEDGKMPLRSRQQAAAGVLDNLMGSDYIKDSDIGTHMMEIAMPKGSKAAHIDAFNSSTGQLDEKTMAHQQMEILLDKGSNFRIADIVQEMDENGQAIPNSFRFILELLQEKEKEGA